MMAERIVVLYVAFNIHFIKFENLTPNIYNNNKTKKKGGVTTVEPMRGYGKHLKLKEIARGACSIRWCGITPR